jgi:hypothetical protein
MATLYLVAAIRKAFARHEEVLAKPGLGLGFDPHMKQLMQEALAARQQQPKPPIMQPTPGVLKLTTKQWNPAPEVDEGDDPARTMRVSRLNLATGEHQHSADENKTHNEVAYDWGDQMEGEPNDEPWVHLSRRSPRSYFAWDGPQEYLEGDRQANKRLMLRKLSPRTPILGYTWSYAINTNNRRAAYADAARHLLAQGFHPSAVFLDKHGDVPQTTLGELAAHPESYLDYRSYNAATAPSLSRMIIGRSK